MIRGTWVGCAVLMFGCSASGGEPPFTPPPPKKSETVSVASIQLRMLYALESVGEGDLTATATFWDTLAGLDDATTGFDLAQNGGAVELSGGDTLYIDQEPSDMTVETATVLHRSVVYSRTVPKGKASYTFELRRANGEVISTEVPTAAPFRITTAPLRGAAVPGVFALSWAPFDPSATAVSIYATAHTEEPGCALFQDTTLAQGRVDAGSISIFAASLTAGVTTDCHYEITVERRHISQTVAKTRIAGVDVPSLNDVRIVASHKEKTTLTLTPN
jgi:hypothetical protein